jgi:hypothetical protein
MMKCFRQYEMFALIFALFYCMQLSANETEAPKPTEEIVTPPAEEKKPGVVKLSLPIGWQLAEKNPTTPHVELMAVGVGKGSYPPSLNLMIEKYSGTMKQYLEMVKTYNKQQHSKWKDLGPLHTPSGNGQLSQLDFTGKWGDEHMMHLMILKDGYMYILTAAALKAEFADHYKEFFAAFRSMDIQDQ